MVHQRVLAGLATIAAGLAATPALAQDDWSGMDLSTLKGQVQQRYDEALALTLDGTTVNANDPRYIWASEAKVQCGIALGYLKSSTRDSVSLGKCAAAYDRMKKVPRPPVVVPPPPPPARQCDRELPGLIFFEFDSATPGPDATQIIEYVTENATPCNWRSFTVVGHTDRSGSNAYNLGLSQRRADAVASLMTAGGIPQGAITTSAQGEEHPRVPTADGVRELQNRRVEIQVSE
ncbi:OmpA family protein [Erythrobacter sp.]|uniref:OmpA family protein n=1 Tax=Erythrobacter sp. TaxID=1042 RepID=UPI00311EB4CD